MNPAVVDDVLVVGGGIGGLASALMLSRSGRRVRVLERGPEFLELGAGLQLAPNATRVLQRHGLLDAVMATALQPRRLVARNAMTGEVLSSLDLMDVERRYGAPYIVLHRTDLLEVILRRCMEEESITLETSKQVTQVLEHADHATVACADGSEYRASIVVGADGLYSAARSLLVTDEPRCSGYVAYRGAVPVEAVEVRSPLEDVVVWMGPGLHLVQYPVRGAELYNQVAVFRSDQYAAGEEDWGTPEELDARFRNCCDDVRRALPALLRHRRWPMYDRAPLTHWSRGRLTLIGDAAHPMLQYLAQGAGQALEDGDALADSVEASIPTSSTAAGDIATAFAAYEQRRLEQATRVQRTALVWGDIWHVDGLAMELRDETFKLRRVDDYRRVDWLYGPPVDRWVRTAGASDALSGESSNRSPAR